jgi:SAM-dependent methyltransferase
MAAGHTSLFRQYQDEFLRRFGTKVTGDIVELGGEIKYAHSRFFPAARSYVVTNVARDFEERVDVTAMPFANDSQDAFVCVSVLAHVRELSAAVSEMRRTLRPGGQIMLTVPFLFPTTDEQDYWRFSRDAIPVIMAGYEIRVLAHLGGRISTVIDLLQRPRGRFQRRDVAYKTVAYMIAALLGRFDALDGYPLGFGIQAVKQG